jgi:uncharacterized protein YutE (UPF0331/DUF86 family)
MDQNAPKKYLGFYPQNLVWVGESVLLSQNTQLSSYTANCQQIVANHQSKYLDLMVTRDGCFLVGLNFSSPTVGLYLDALNALYIILENQASQFFFKKYFNIREITIQDYIYFGYTANNIANVTLDNCNTLTRYLFGARYLSGFIPIESNKIDFVNDKFWGNLFLHTINNDTRYQSRKDRILPISIVQNTFKTFERLSANWDKITLLSKLIKAINELNLGNYEYVIGYAWLIIEGYLFELHTQTEKKYSLAQSDDSITTLEVINNLRRLKLLSGDIVSELHQLRKIRNQIIHRQFKDVKMQDAVLAIEIIREFIKRDTAIDIRLVY